MSLNSQVLCNVGLAQHVIRGNWDSQPQCFLGQCCKTLLLLQGHSSALVILQKTTPMLRNISRNYSTITGKSKHLKPIAPGQTVQLWLPSESTWSADVCTDLVGPRGYGHKVRERSYRRNCRLLIEADELCIHNFPIMHTTSKSQCQLERPHLCQILRFCNINSIMRTEWVTIFVVFV